MTAWWVGTVSALAGAAAAGGFQLYRERVAHRRELKTRWDDTLRIALADYLSSADRALRSMLRCRRAIHGGENAETTRRLKLEALKGFEELHNRSQAVTLLTGDRADKVRQLAREMRKQLLPLAKEVRGGVSLSDQQVKDFVKRHREARNELIDAAQVKLGVKDAESSSDTDLMSDDDLEAWVDVLGLP